MQFDDLIGKTFDFYCDAAHRLFKLDDAVFSPKVGVDYYEKDGTLHWCSFLEDVERLEYSAAYVNKFPALPWARVTVLREGVWSNSCGESYDFNGYRLEDSSGHAWLIFGTLDRDLFQFRYKPSPAIKDLLKIEDPVARDAALAAYLLEQQRLDE